MARLPFHNGKVDKSSSWRWLLRLSRWSSRLKWIIPLAILSLLCFHWLYEIHIEIFLYSKGWLDREISSLEPISSCFDPNRISPEYNVSSAFGSKNIELHAGIPLRIGLDCYDLAGSIPTNSRSQDSSHIFYHTYWRSDLAKFGERQEYFLKSFFATQDLEHSTLILWSNDKLLPNKHIEKWIHRFPHSFELRIANVPLLAEGTALQGSPYLSRKDNLAWVDGDLLRLLVVWHFGGIWVDLDTLFTRDVYPLLEHEFFTQWDCYDKKYTPFNGAFFHFYRKSPYLCEAFHIMATGPPPRLSSTDWGSTMYLKLWRRLVAAHIPPFKILPFCFTDGRSCRMDNRLPDPFRPDPRNGRWPLRGPQYADPRGAAPFAVGGILDRTLDKVFGVHLHNQWNKNFPKGGWVRRLLLDRYDTILED